MRGAADDQTVWQLERGYLVRPGGKWYAMSGGSKKAEQAAQIFTEFIWGLKRVVKREI